MQAASGLRQVDRRHAQQQRRGRHQLEVDERLDADASHLAQRALSGDAHHQRGEDQRTDHHADQAQEDGGERLQVTGKAGKGEADTHPGQQTDRDPAGEREASHRRSA